MNNKKRKPSITKLQTDIEITEKLEVLYLELQPEKSFRLRYENCLFLNAELLRLKKPDLIATVINYVIIIFSD